MLIYGKVRSTVPPIPLKIDEQSVWVSRNVTAVDSENGIEYEYDLLHYTKDEYIRLLDNQVTDTQVALVELFERMV